MTSGGRRVDCRAAVVVLVLAAAALLPGVALAKPSEHPFELVPGSFHVSPSTLRSAAHEDLTTSFDFEHEEVAGANTNTYNDLRTVTVELPPGFIGNNTAVPTCSDAQLLAIAGIDTNAAQCPIASQVGLISFEVPPPQSAGSAPSHFTVPIYNMETTSPGVVAELGFKSVIFTQILQIRVRPGDSGLTITTPDVTKIEPRNIQVVVWGVPAAHEHDAARGETCGESFEVPAVCHNEFGGPQEAHWPIVPYLANSTSCGTSTAHFEAYSWEEPLSPVMAEDQIGPLVECERVPFEPSISVRPTTAAAESPSGLNAVVEVPQDWENANTLASANVKDTVLTLPVGYTINPSSGSGLGVCTPQQLEAETYSSPPGAGCPEQSKIGTVSVETPVLAEKVLSGAVFVADPYNNKPEFGTPEHPGGSLLALYVVVKDPARGIIVKLAGKIEPNETTGQLTTHFPNSPQVPFSKFTLKLHQGTTSPLVSPPACGTYTAQAQITPWSTPTTPRELTTPPFQVEQGIGNGPCPAGGIPPFAPQVVSGTQNDSAGSYSPFYLRIVRKDGEQELTKFTTVLPPGLTANLTGIPFCPDADVQAARETTGAQQETDPSCPAASEIGHTLVGAGVGTVLAWTPGKVYLAGPYHGSALSIVSVTSAKVGPFDLGTVVIRFALRINPITGQAEIDGSGSDPIPHIIEGIVVHVREIHVYIDRPKFMINPTSCAPMSISDAITGAGADAASSADDQTVGVTTRFQDADCASLGFKPRFTAGTSGKTSRSMGASLHVALSYPGTAPGSQANVRSVKVDLPKQLPSRLPTLQKACTAATFNANPAACPAASRVGVAKAITPILPVPLEGPAYFVSYGGAKFPELIIVLQGYGITIDLHGETFISEKTSITSSTFRAVPDEPVTSFELTLPEGANSALAANTNLCAIKRTTIVRVKRQVKVGGRTRTVTRRLKKSVPAPLLMPTTFTAQNGLTYSQKTQIAVGGCARKPAKKAGARTSGHGRRGGGST